MKKIIGIIICMLMVLPVFSMSVTADISNDQTELIVHFLGSFRLFATRTFGVVIKNIGDTTAQNLYYTISLKGSFDKYIDFKDEGPIQDIEPLSGWGLGFGGFIKGFGFVTIEFSLTCSNADDISRTIIGFQLGYQTIVFGI